MLSSTWTSIVTRYPPATIEVTGSALLQLTILLLYFAKSFTTRPKDRPALLHCLPLCITNIVLAGVSHAVFLYIVSLTRDIPFEETSLSTISPNLPSIQELSKGFIQGTILFDITFYTLHTLLHRGILYKRIHSVHHRFVSSVSLAAYYSHPAEFVLVNFGSAVILSSLMRAHVVSQFIMGALSQVIALYIHEQGEISWLLVSHDGHHVRPGTNLGSVGVMDWLCGTLGR
ncbi:hypothetical protein BDW74DRAFT_162856 [Aspergillus multicolor]|uniref:sterol desaturase family protein n=1 Tax=Aspergillus multicolor TaxID=41759 RepID=UPI003CCD6F9F